MRVLDLFAGIGGFSLAAHWMGWETAAFVEWNMDCQAVLKKNFPGVPIYGDVNKFYYAKEKRRIGAIDIVCAGFPCQPYSINGKRKGAEDDRDQWGETVRVLSESGAAFFLGENVVNILNMGFDRFLADLENIGYTPITFDISADAVGLQTMERHIWIIAASNEVGFKRKWKKQVQDKLSIQRQFQGGDKRIRERRYLSETRFCRVCERVSSRLDKSEKTRLEQIGNAVPPQVVYEIFKAIENNCKKLQ
jgi:DNA (cytosine-5)-methyltransferase 1